MTAFYRLQFPYPFGYDVPLALCTSKKFQLEEKNIIYSLQISLYQSMNGKKLHKLLYFKKFQIPRKSGASDNAKLAEIFRQGPRNGDVSTDVVTVVTNRPILNIGIPPVFYSINYFSYFKDSMAFCFSSDSFALVWRSKEIVVMVWVLVVRSSSKPATFSFNTAFTFSVCQNF